MEVIDQIAYATSDGSKHNLSGTFADANRFYDDKNTWTGTAGGNSIAQEYMPPPTGKVAPPLSVFSALSSPSATTPSASISAHELVVPEDQFNDLCHVYEEYSIASRSLKDRGAISPLGGDDGIDSSRFLKLCNDAQLFDGVFRLQDIDIIFAKCKARDARKLSMDSFCSSLTEICKKKKCDMRSLVDKIIFATSNGPHINGTTAEANRFHDDKNTYTGAKGYH